MAPQNVAIEIQTIRKRDAIKANAMPNMNASEILIAFQPHEVLGVQLIAMCLVPFDHQKWQRLVNWIWRREGLKVPKKTQAHWLALAQ
jgi:hypothetical protein